MDHPKNEPLMTFFNESNDLFSQQLKRRRQIFVKIRALKPVNTVGQALDFKG